MLKGGRLLNAPLSLSWLFFLPLCAMNTQSSHALKDFQLLKPQKLVTLTETLNLSLLLLTGYWPTLWIP